MKVYIWENHNGDTMHAEQIGKYKCMDCNYKHTRITLFHLKHNTISIGVVPPSVKMCCPFPISSYHLLYTYISNGNETLICSIHFWFVKGNMLHCSYIACHKMNSTIYIRDGMTGDDGDAVERAICVRWQTGCMKRMCLDYGMEEWKNGTELGKKHLNEQKRTFIKLKAIYFSADFFSTNFTAIYWGTLWVLTKANREKVAISIGFQFILYEIWIFLLFILLKWLRSYYSTLCVKQFNKN